MISVRCLNSTVARKCSACVQKVQACPEHASECFGAILHAHSVTYVIVARYTYGTRYKPTIRLLLGVYQLEAQEWKLHTDIVAFEQELRRFILRYPEPLELQNWFPRGLVLPLLDLLAGSLPQPMADRALQIWAPVFRLQKRWPCLQLSVHLAAMRLCRVSDDRTTMQIAAQSDAGQVFIDAFIRRCQELCDATRLSQATAANHATDEQPLEAGAQKTNGSAFDRREA
jgi:hypothetical protein